MMMCASIESRHGQRGVALFISLVMLLILTLLGVSAVQTTALQERMSRNSFDNNLAFQATESAVRDAEDFIEDNFNSLVMFDTAGAEDNGFYYDNEWNETPNWENIDWDTDQECDPSSVPTGVRAAETEVPGVCVQPKYIIEHVKTVVSDQDRLNLDNIGQGTGTGRTQVFRITALGTGGTKTAHVLLQTTYGKKF
ncbi:MAG: PilX N-terminal domain-containing pilus assembly protein [Gammaproteobacteria bacterium]|nr:PilX N-terminal domain-containing pilus assembly protein [Gammaproteobacteria bacterium]